MQNPTSLQTVVTLANGAELVCAIAKEVLGNDVADMVQGNELTTNAVRAMAMAQFQSTFDIYRGGN